MVRAILDGRKTQTRKICKFESIDSWEISCLVRNGVYFRIKDRPDIPSQRVDCPYGQVGDRLWVRETFRYVRVGLGCGGSAVGVEYKTGDIKFNKRANKYTKQARNKEKRGHHAKWRPSIFMPRWAARIWLEITNIRVERVQDISWKDILAEGCDVNKPTGDPAIDDFTAGVEATDTFHWLWDSINAKRGYGWDKNPWVWVIEFKAV